MRALKIKLYAHTYRDTNYIADYIADQMGLAFLLLGQKNYFQEMTQLRRKNTSSPQQSQTYD